MWQAGEASPGTSVMKITIQDVQQIPHRTLLCKQKSAILGPAKMAPTSGGSLARPLKEEGIVSVGWSRGVTKGKGRLR